MPDETPTLLHRLVGGDTTASAEVLDQAALTTSPSLLVAAAILTPDAHLLVRAGRLAGTTRDRQLVSLADAHLRGDGDLFDVLVRDHLAEYPDNLLAAWIAGLPPHDA